MGELLRLAVRNYRCLQDVDFAAAGINVLFGPNGVGKTTFLDALWFVRDCFLHGTAEAILSRPYRIASLSDAASSGDERIDIDIETNAVTYRITFDYSAGRIPLVGERLLSKTRETELLKRDIGRDGAYLYLEELRTAPRWGLSHPEDLALKLYASLSKGDDEGIELVSLLRSMHCYSSREVNLSHLRRLGCESGVHTYPSDRWENLFSALRNLNDQRAIDNRFKIIIEYMRKAFPQSFKDLVLEIFLPNRVGGSFVEYGRRRPIPASGVSDGHLQLLGLLTALFGDMQDRSSLLLFDEPEISLHPHALAVFAEAVREAVQHWNRQVFVATHSPVLISQFEPSDVVVAEAGEDRSTTLRRVSEIAELQDLIEQYSVGSLYMAEQVGAQSILEMQLPTGENDE